VPTVSLHARQTTKLSIGMGLPFNVNGNRRQMPWQV